MTNNIINDQNKTIENIVIVGGGAAGWLTANHLAVKLKPLVNKHLSITLIESPDIPTIGVGEGTVPMIRKTLQLFGIDEGDFIKECDVTFKQGIKFANWTYNPDQKPNDYFHHLFDYPLINELDKASEYWLARQNDDTSSFVDTLSWQGKLCDQGLAPKNITDPQYQGRSNYAYHLDAGKFSKLLSENACQKLGVKHVKANVKHVNVAENGDITSLITDTAGIIDGQLFVDCSGFRALLIEKALGVEFVDKNNVLFTDTALAVQLPYDTPNQAIRSYTKSTAQKNGWIWDIGLTTRRGTGFVYSSSHTSEDAAIECMNEYLKQDCQTLAMRKISMKIGHRKTFWKNNCVAIGLSQGFVEPLEATGLLVFDVTAKMLADLFPSNRIHMDLVAKKYNERVQSSWEKVIEFIKLHYFISKRDDSEFWLDNRNANSCPEALLERLELWSYQVPNAYDFASGFEIFNLENYLYVLYGMHYKTATTPEMLLNKKQAEQFFAKVKGFQQQICQEMPKNRELINKIKQFGLQNC